MKFLTGCAPKIWSGKNQNPPNLTLVPPIPVFSKVHPKRSVTTIFVYKLMDHCSYVSTRFITDFIETNAILKAKDGENVRKLKKKKTTDAIFDIFKRSNKRSTGLISLTSKKNKRSMKKNKRSTGLIKNGMKKNKRSSGLSSIVNDITSLYLNI